MSSCDNVDGDSSSGKEVPIERSTYVAWDARRRAQVAVKLEGADSSRRAMMLRFEHALYERMSGSAGIPWVGEFVEDATIRDVDGNTVGNPPYRVMVMQLLGDSLADLSVRCGGRLSLKTVLMLAEQMLTRLETVHEHDFVHRDIKPHSFVMGLGDDAAVVFLVDLGLAKRYRRFFENRRTGEVREKHVVSPDPPGTARPDAGDDQYASARAQSRRDDMEALGYVLVYLLRGFLPVPWQDGSGGDSNGTLCQGCPTEFERYFEHCRGLAYEDRPDYTSLRHMFRRLFQELGYRRDYVYDWDDNNRE